MSQKTPWYIITGDYILNQVSTLYGFQNISFPYFQLLMVQCHEKRQFDGWRSQSGLKAAISGDIAIPPPLPAKGWEVLREKNATKFEPNLGHTSSCGLIFPPFVGAIQARWIPKPALITHGRRQGGSKCESSIKPLPALDFYSRFGEHWVFLVHICWNARISKSTLSKWNLHCRAFCQQNWLKIHLGVEYHPCVQTSLIWRGFATDNSTPTPSSQL